MELPQARHEPLVLAAPRGLVQQAAQLSVLSEDGLQQGPDEVHVVEGRVHLVDDPPGQRVVRREEYPHPGVRQSGAGYITVLVSCRRDKGQPRREGLTGVEGGVGAVRTMRGGTGTVRGVARRTRRCERFDQWTISRVTSPAQRRSHISE